MSELICNELAKSYSHFQLSPTSFQLESGYLTVLAGKNGSGKSTLLRCLAGIDPTCTGDVTLDGISLKKEPDSYKDQIGYGCLIDIPLCNNRSIGTIAYLIQ